MGSQDWMVVKVRRDVVERVREELRVATQTPKPLPYAQVMEAALNSLSREARGELYSGEDMRAVMQSRILEAKRLGAEAAVSAIMGRPVRAFVDKDGEVRFAPAEQVDAAGGG